MLCVGVAVIWTLAFESPIIVLEKVLFSMAPNNVAKQQSDNSSESTANISDSQEPIIMNTDEEKTLK